MAAMARRAELLRATFDRAFRVLDRNLRDLTLEEALFTPQGGYRSTLGILKHTAAWAHVYHSFAFEPEPRNWHEIDWPRGLRDTVDTSQAYLDEVLVWLRRSHELWMASLSSITEADVDSPRTLHWGETIPLSNIVVMIGGDYIYHAGEINMLLSMTGHRVRPPWLG
jgi:uncharacterized damage-inducible protein DinB